MAKSCANNHSPRWKSVTNPSNSTKIWKTKDWLHDSAGQDSSRTLSLTERCHDLTLPFPSQSQKHFVILYASTCSRIDYYSPSKEAKDKLKFQKTNRQINKPMQSNPSQNNAELEPPYRQKKKRPRLSWQHSRRALTHVLFAPLQESLAQNKRWIVWTRLKKTLDHWILWKLFI